MEFKQQYKEAFSQVRPRPDFQPEELMMNQKNTHTPIGKLAAFVLTVALIVALSVTAYATELFGLWDLAGPIETFEQFPVETQSEQTRYYISGFAHSAESEAYEQWQAVLWELPIASKEETAAYGKGLAWYGCFSRTAEEALHKIADEHGLKLHEEITYTENGYRFPSGAFKDELYYVPEQQGPILISISNIVKGYLPSYCISIGNPDSYTTEEYVTASGQSVVLAYVPQQENEAHIRKFLILANLGDSVVVVHGTDWGDGGDPLPAWPNHHITVENLKALAERIDYEAVQTGFADGRAYDRFTEAIGTYRCPDPPRKLVGWSEESGYTGKFLD